MQLVVVMAVRKAVSAATITFTAISIRRVFFMILHSSFFTLHLDLIAVAVIIGTTVVGSTAVVLTTVLRVLAILGVLTVLRILHGSCIG